MVLVFKQSLTTVESGCYLSTLLVETANNAIRVNLIHKCFESALILISVISQVANGCL